MRVSGGVCTGVMVLGPTVDALAGGGRAEAEAAYIVSYEGLADRGLGSLPGGDESELVNGVRALRAVGWPARDMAEGAEKVDEACVGVEQAESTSLSSSRGCCASLVCVGDGTLILALGLRASRPANGAIAVDGVVVVVLVVVVVVVVVAVAVYEGKGKVARCEAARRSVRAFLSPRLFLDMDSMPERPSDGSHRRGASAHRKWMRCLSGPLTAPLLCRTVDEGAKATRRKGRRRGGQRVADCYGCCRQMQDAHQDAANARRRGEDVSGPAAAARERAG